MVNINYEIGPFTSQQEGKERREWGRDRVAEMGRKRRRNEKKIPKTIQLPLDYLKFLSSHSRSGETCHSMMV